MTTLYVRPYTKLYITSSEGKPLCALTTAANSTITISDDISIQMNLSELSLEDLANFALMFANPETL